MIEQSKIDKIHFEGIFHTALSFEKDSKEFFYYSKIFNEDRKWIGNMKYYPFTKILEGYVDTGKGISDVIKFEPKSYSEIVDTIFEAIYNKSSFTFTDEEIEDFKTRRKQYNPFSLIIPMD